MWLAFVSGPSAQALAEPLVHRVSILAGADVSPRPFSGHGIGILEYDLGPLRRGAHFILGFNSDTLRIAVDRIRLGSRVELGAELRGELFQAGLLPDYWRDGARDAGRGLRASYGSASTWVKVLAAPSYIDVSLTARRWIFTRTSVRAAPRRSRDR